MQVKTTSGPIHGRWARKAFKVELGSFSARGGWISGGSQDPRRSPGDPQETPGDPQQTSRYLVFWIISRHLFCVSSAALRASDSLTVPVQSRTLSMVYDVVESSIIGQPIDNCAGQNDLRADPWPLGQNGV